MSASIRTTVATFVALITVAVTLAAHVPTASAAGSGWPVLSRGDRGPDVGTAQFFLRDALPGRPEIPVLIADGIFGPRTQRVVRRFQRRNDLTADGIIGRRTWNALLVTVRRGDRSEVVLTLQSQLRSQGYDLAVDGVFGPQTQAVVRRFQRDVGILVDGIVGPITTYHLIRRANH